MTTELKTNAKNMSSASRELRVTLACSLPLEVANAVLSIAESKGHTKSQVMRNLIMSGLSHET